MYEIYETEYQIVYRGVDYDLIKTHIESKIQKVLCIYDTKENFLQKDLVYTSDWLALYQIPAEVQDNWIIKRHSSIEGYVSLMIKPLCVVGGYFTDKPRIV